MSRNPLEKQIEQSKNKSKVKLATS